MHRHFHNTPRASWQTACARLGRVLIWLVALVGPAQGATLTNDWQAIIGAVSDSSPAIGPDGRLYFGAFDGRFWALNADGSQRWIFHAGREIKSSPALGPDGRVYFGCRDRKFYCVDSAGRKLWDFKTSGWIDSSPALADDGAIYFGGWDKNFYALNPDGSERWRFSAGGPVVSSPAIAAEGTVYFGCHDGKFYALSPAGAKVWEYAAGAAIVSSPAIGQDGVVYFTSVDGWFYALQPEGALRWRLKTGGITESSPVIGEDGTLYVGVNLRLWAIRPEGTKKWDAGLDRGLIEAAPLALHDGSVCFTGIEGTLVCIDTQQRYPWSYYTAFGHAPPVVGANGTIYAFGQILNVGNVFRALKAEVPLAQSSWPKFRGNSANTGRARSK